MNKKIVLGIIGLAVVIGVAGVAASTTYARGGMTRGNGYSASSGQGMMRNATSTVAVAAQRDAMIAQHDAMQQAIASGDYATWRAAADTLEAVRPEGAQGKGMTTIITESNFAQFVAMHKLMQQADSIGKELGLNQGAGRGPGMHGNGMRHRFVTNTAATN